jgi:pantetheine-phosphate adenylyltransferase
MAKAIFPGSFDPPTYGHLNIIERARTIFDEIHVLIAVNRNKKTLFSPDERYEMLRALVASWDNVVVDMYAGLVAEYAEKSGVNVLIRGIRNVEDFMYEFDISLVNRALNPKLETIFIPTEQRFFVLNSSIIKEVAAFNGNMSSMAPPLVVEALKNKFRE